ncbi:MAG: Hsp70 family protein [Bacillota bacterium]
MDDIDVRLARLLAQRFFARTGVDLTLDETAFALVVRTARQARARLETSALASVSLPFIVAGEKGPLHLDDILSRDDLDALTAGT